MEKSYNGIKFKVGDKVTFTKRLLEENEGHPWILGLVEESLHRKYWVIKEEAYESSDGTPVYRLEDERYAFVIRATWLEHYVEEENEEERLLPCFAFTNIAKEKEYEKTALDLAETYNL